MTSTVGQGPLFVILVCGGGGNCMTGSSTCDLGEVTVRQGQVLVLHLHYFLPHTKFELYKRKTTVEKESKSSPSCMFEWAENREAKSKWMVAGFM